MLGGEQEPVVRCGGIDGDLDIGLVAFAAVVVDHSAVAAGGAMLRLYRADRHGTGAGLRVLHVYPDEKFY